MISVILSTYNDADALVEALQSLVPAAVEGVIREVVVADGGSSDASAAIADAMGANVFSHSGGLAEGLNAAAQAARGPWLFCMPANVRLGIGFQREAVRIVETDRDVVAVVRTVRDHPRALPDVSEILRHCANAVANRVTLDDCLLLRRATLTGLGGFVERSTGAAALKLRDRHRITIDAYATRTPAGSDRAGRLGQTGWTREPRAGKSATQTSGNEVTY